MITVSYSVLPLQLETRVCSLFLLKPFAGFAVRLQQRTSLHLFWCGFRVLENSDGCSFQMIDQYLNGMEQELVLPITCQGRIDALAMWFDLRLDSICSLSSGPEANSCWEQAIFPVLQAHLASKSEHILFQKCCCEGRSFEFRNAFCSVESDTKLRFCDFVRADVQRRRRVKKATVSARVCTVKCSCCCR